MTPLDSVLKSFTSGYDGKSYTAKADFYLAGVTFNDFTGPNIIGGVTVEMP